MSLIEALSAKLLVKIYVWLLDWILPWIQCICMWEQWVIWYFRLGGWLSPKRKHQKTHPCSCAKSRLGELRSL